MRRVRVEMLYHLRSADCASAYCNLGRAIWRLQRSIKLDVGLLPVPIPAEPMRKLDFELHCLIQHTQRVGRQHAIIELLDATVARARTTASCENVWDLATQVGIEPPAAPFATQELAVTVHRALERATELDPVRVPAFLINDDHLLHGNASPAFIHDVLQTLAEPRNTTARNPSTVLP